MDVLCAILTAEDNDDHRKEVLRMSRNFIGLEFASMILALATSHHMSLVGRALRLGMLLLRAESYNDNPSEKRCGHAFQVAFNNNRRALVAFRRVFDDHKQRLEKRQHETKEDLAELDQSEESLDANVTEAILQLVELLCADCNTSFQTLFRHQENVLEQCNLVGAIADLSLAYANLMKWKMKEDWDFDESTRLHHPQDRSVELGREVNDNRSKQAVGLLWICIIFMTIL